MSRKRQIIAAPKDKKKNKLKHIFLQITFDSKLTLLSCHVKGAKAPFMSVKTAALLHNHVKQQLETYWQ